MRRVCLVLVAAFLAWCVDVRVSAVEKSAVPAFTQIPIDLTAPVIDQVLPFDVPFLFSGTTPAGAVELNATWVDITMRAKAAQRTAARTGAPQPEFGCPAEDAPGWKPLRTILGQNGRFVIQVPRLDANRYYCFNFNTKKELSATALDAFKSAAALAFDERLRRVGNEFQSADALKRLRADLILAVTPPQANIKLAVKRNSIFETIDLVKQPERAEDLRTIEQKFEEVVRPLRQYQAQRTGAIRTFKNFADASANEILKWATEDPVFRQVTQQLASLAPASPAFAAIGDKRPLFDRYVLLKPSDLVDLVFGGPRDSEVEMNVWSASEVDARLTRLTAAQTDLDAMAGALQQLNTPARVEALGGGLTSAQLTTLQTQIASTAATLKNNEIPALTSLQRMLDRRQTEIARIVSELSARLVEDVVLLATSVGDFSTRHNWYLSADVGFSWAWDLNEVFPYAGMNVYFRPVNKDAPLAEFGSFANSFTRRFSAMVGVTVAGNLAKAGEREALFGTNRMLVLGAGLRLTDSLRFTGGALILKALDPNPLIDRKRIHASPFVSFSVDWNVRDAFLGLGTSAANPNPTPP